MFVILVLLGVFLLVSAVLTWDKIYHLENEIKNIKDQFLKQKYHLSSNQEKNILRPIAEENNNFYPPKIPQTQQNLQLVENLDDKENDHPDLKKEDIKKNKMGFEQRFGVRLPIWIGGIALALSGFFLVKYSIDIGILNKNMRLSLASVFGLSLLLAGNKIHSNDKIANYRKISQTLVGAAISVLYVCCFVATSFYQIFPVYIGFALMVLITIIAVLMSLKMGQAVAIFSLIGGFLTPIITLSDQPNSLILFGYFYLLFASFLTFIRRQNWWIMLIPLIAISFIWIIGFMLNSRGSEDDFYLGIFIIAICITFIAQTISAIDSKKIEQKFYSIINYLVCGSSLALISLIADRNNYGLVELVFFAILSLGSVIIAVIRQKTYAFIPLIAAAFSVLILYSANLSNFQLLNNLIGFGLIFIVSGYFAIWKSFNPKIWAILISATSWIYCLIGYDKIYYSNELIVKSNQISAEFVWFKYFFAVLSSLGCFWLVMIIKKVRKIYADKSQINADLTSIFFITANAFFSLTFFIILSQQFLATFFASQILLIAMIGRKIEIKNLKEIAKVYVFIYLASLLFDLDVALNSYAIFSLGLSSIMIFAASSFFDSQFAIFEQSEKGDKFVKFLEILSISLAVIYVFSSLDFNSLKQDLFNKTAVFSNILLLLSAFLAWLGLKFKAKNFKDYSDVINLAAMILISIFLLIIFNPLLSRQMVAGYILFNSLALSYLTPILFLTFAANKNNYLNFYKFVKPFSFILLFSFISLNIRQIFNGKYLNIFPITIAENYCLSLAWIISGIILLLFGTKLRNKNIRIAALGLVIIASVKIFIFDGSLTGLYRVFSFLGLGIVLIAISWFYTKFVKDDES